MIDLNYCILFFSNTVVYLVPSYHHISELEYIYQTINTDLGIIINSYLIYSIIDEQVYMTTFI